MTDYAEPGAAVLHDELVRAVEALPGVSRLVPSYRELLGRTAQKLLGGEAEEASGLDIVVRADSGTRIYVDVFAARGHETGTLVDTICETMHGVLLMHRASDPLPDSSLHEDAVSLRVRVLGVE